MPFPPQTPRPFTKEGVEWLKEGQTGCYGLQQNNQGRVAWIYVGKAVDIRARLLQHLGHDNPCIDKYWPTHFVASVTSDLDGEEKRLIIEHDPHCNKKVG